MRRRTTLVAACLMAASIAVLLATPLQAEGDCDALGCAFRSGLLESGEEWSYTFNEAREYPFHCHPHPWMTGKLTVTEAPEGSETKTHRIAFLEPDEEDSDSWRFQPANLTVHVADTVTFVNVGDTAHEIMGFAGAEGLAAHAATHDHGDHDHGPSLDEETPGVPALVTGLVLAVAAVLWGQPRQDR